MAVTATPQIIDRLNDLIHLDYDAAAAYQASIDRLSDQNLKTQLRKFMGDHERHVRDLAQLVGDMGGTPASQGDAKQILTQGKVFIGSITGDKGIMQAMKSNEDTTNKKYEEALQIQGLPPEARTVLERNLGDERRHRSWIVEQLNKM